MNMEEKMQYIKQYINDIEIKVNDKYGAELIDNDKISRALKMFQDSPSDLKTEIIPQINKLVQQIIDDYLELQKKLEEMMRKAKEENLNELATLNLNTEENGIFLSQQQIDLLMITELNSKDDLKKFTENICGQFPNMKVEDIISDFDSLQPNQLEQAKRTLYKKYQDGLIDYLDNAKMTDTEKAKVKLERLGIKNQELEMCLSQVSQGKINETFTYLGKKHGDDFITKFNHTMNDDFENVKAISYDEMKSLSELISRDKTIDTIIIATGKFDNSVYPTLNGKVFDPYLTQKGVDYCASHNKHMRYQGLFDQAHVEVLLKEGKGLKDHYQILNEMKVFVKNSMDYIEKNNKKLPDGTMLINTVEVFNELVEKNKSDKSSPYDMVWEKYFGITTDELVSCFDGVKKPDGVEFMYNETTLTESAQKRKAVEKLLFQIEQQNPNLIDSFGDQMHLSEEDVITKQGEKNLKETAQMIKRIQDGKIIVDGEFKNIKSKKTECSEHDFHFSSQFLDEIKKVNQSDKDINLWSVKREMQNTIGKTYVKNGVEFSKSTYWSLFGKNDHNLVRENIKIQRENQERKQKGLPPKPLVETMLAGLVPDGKKLTDVKSLKSQSQERKHKEEPNYIKWNSESEKKKYKLIKEKNQIKKMFYQQQHQKQMQNSNVKVLKKTNNNTGFVNALLLTLIIACVGIIIFAIIMFVINK